MKLTKQQLRKIIQEELSYILEEEEIDEGLKDMALAGAIGLGSLFSGGAQAAEPIQKPTATQVSQDKKEVGSISDIEQAALGFLEKWHSSRLKKRKSLSFEDMEKLIQAQKALASGKSIKDNSFYDTAKQFVSSTKEKDPELFDFYFKAGNPKYFTFN